MIAEQAVKRITFDRSEASPGETLYVAVPKFNEHKVLVPGLLRLLFNINLEEGHINNFLVQNIARVLVNKLVVKYAGTILQDTVGYDIYKIWENLFLSKGTDTKINLRVNPQRRSLKGIFLLCFEP